MRFTDSDGVTYTITPPTRFLMDERRHIVCLPYSVAGLHAMAESLGLKRCWFHGGKYPHYDAPKKRIAELKKKCEIVSSREILAVCKGESL